MNEPTEHAKQIAREAAERIGEALKHYYGEGEALFEQIEPELIREFLAITAANQQRNEDTARLDWLDEQGHFVLTRPRWEVYGKDINCERIRDAIDAARGVQPAAKEKVAMSWGRPLSEEMAEWSAAKQEGAPAPTITPDLFQTGGDNDVRLYAYDDPTKYRYLVHVDEHHLEPFIAAANREVKRLVAAVSQQPAPAAEQACPFCGGTAGHWEGCRAPHEAAPSPAQEKPPTDAEVQQWLRECDEGKHPLSAEDQAALDRASAEFPAKLRAAQEKRVEASVEAALKDLVEAVEAISPIYRHKTTWAMCDVTGSLERAQAALATASPSEDTKREKTPLHLGGRAQGLNTRVLMPYTRLNPHIVGTIRGRYGIALELVEMTDDEHYWRLLSELWHVGEDVIIVEHDCLPWPGALEELEACPAHWCSYTYAINGGYGIHHAFGTTKLSGALMRKVPDVWRAADDRRWHTLDAQLCRAALLAGETPHPHRPPIIHLKENELAAAQ